MDTSAVAVDDADAVAFGGDGNDTAVGGADDVRCDIYAAMLIQEAPERLRRWLHRSLCFCYF